MEKKLLCLTDWQSAVGDSEGTGDIEVLPSTRLNDRGFEAFFFF